MATIERSFIVEIGGGAGPGDDRLRGHVEHVATGQACDFTSLQALADFFTRTIAETTAVPARRDRGAGDHR